MLRCHRLQFASGSVGLQRSAKQAFGDLLHQAGDFTGRVRKLASVLKRWFQTQPQEKTGEHPTTDVTWHFNYQLLTKHLIRHVSLWHHQGHLQTIYLSIAVWNRVFCICVKTKHISIVYIISTSKINTYQRAYQIIISLCPLHWSIYFAVSQCIFAAFPLRFPVVFRLVLVLQVDSNHHTVVFKVAKTCTWKIGQ